MSRILARRCSIFRESCASFNLNTRSFTKTRNLSQEESSIPKSILEYRQWKTEAPSQRSKSEKTGSLSQHNEHGKESNLGQRKAQRGHTTPSIRKVAAPAAEVKIRYVTGEQQGKMARHITEEKLVAQSTQSTQPRGKVVPDPEIIAMLSKPTWSVRSLLPPTTPTKTITQKQLHHLLRLSALPLPKDQAEEEKMLDSLHSQLHFVSDIQSVNTEGVEPLVRIAEETEEAMKENTIGLEDLKHVIDDEIVVGRNRRRRRVRKEGIVGEGEDWDVFSTAGETVDVPGSGRYFVVRSGKGVPIASGEAVA